ncbi:MAG: hypothetical protein KBI44_14990 [Thermoanaerobaculia bacterium]|nr:hypothetical protein [Thermoanaerobaculia bacterium]
MRLYSRTHDVSCGIDLHARTMYLCVLDRAGQTLRSESAGKLGGSRGRKQGNVHLKWAFSEAAVLLLRNNPRAQKLHSRLVARFGKARALSVLAHKLGRAVFHMQKRQQPFDAERFYREA